MALIYEPPVGGIFMCEFPPCFSPPEMVKTRAVIVINPRIPGRRDMCTVVPISDTPPNPAFAHHCLLPDAMLPSYMRDGRGRWVKGDMVYALATSRLTPVRLKGRGPDGKRRSEYPKLDLRHLRMVRACVASGLGIGPELFNSP